MIDLTQRSRKTESLSEIMARLLRATADYDPVADYPLALLLDLPPTEQLRTERDILAAALEEPVAAELAESREVADHRCKLGVQLQASELKLRRGKRRDTLQAERPAGCWCLGLRGRGDAFVAYYHGTDSHGRPVGWLVRDQQGEPIPGFLDYCPCPDGQALDGANTALAALAANEHRARSAASLWHGVGIPTRAADATFDGWRDRAVLRGADRERCDVVLGQLRSWLDMGRWLVLWGVVGRGKTGLAAVLAKEFARRGQSVLFRTVPDMLDGLRATYDGDGREADLLAALYDVDVLELDDVGVDGPTDWAIGRLFRVVNRRYDAGRRTILTTNLEPNALAAYVGVRNFDRIREQVGSVGMVRLDGPNLRNEVR
jgi:hypothetical protein